MDAYPSEILLFEKVHTFRLEQLRASKDVFVMPSETPLWSASTLQLHQIEARKSCAGSCDSREKESDLSSSSLSLLIKLSSLHSYVGCNCHRQSSLLYAGVRLEGNMGARFSKSSLFSTREMARRVVVYAVCAWLGNFNFLRNKGNLSC